MNIRNFAVASSLVALALSTPALAADDGDAITVLATGQSQPVNETGQSVSVVDLSEIQSIQGRT
jgi:vitamin B12 transporter